MNQSHVWCNCLTFINKRNFVTSPLKISIYAILRVRLCLKSATCSLVVLHACTYLQFAVSPLNYTMSLFHFLSLNTISCESVLEYFYCHYLLKKRFSIKITWHECIVVNFIGIRNTHRHCSRMLHFCKHWDTLYRRLFFNEYKCIIMYKNSTLRTD